VATVVDQFCIVFNLKCWCSNFW